MALSMKNPGLEIRTATEADVAIVLSFIKKLAAYEKLQHEVVASETLLRETLFTAVKSAEAAIGFLDGAPVGFVIYFYNYSTFLARRGIYIEDLYVDEDFRGRGVGRALLIHVARLAYQRGCGRLEWAVLDWNLPAIQFYKHLGAVPMSDWTVFRLTDKALAKLAAEHSDPAVLTVSPNNKE